MVNVNESALTVNTQDMSILVVDKGATPSDITEMSFYYDNGTGATVEFTRSLDVTECGENLSEIGVLIDTFKKFLSNCGFDAALIDEYITNVHEVEESFDTFEVDTFEADDDDWDDGDEDDEDEEDECDGDCDNCGVGQVLGLMSLVARLREQESQNS